MLVESIRSPHLIPTNNPNYKVQEANLLVLANIGIHAEMTHGGLTVTLDVTQLAIPTEVDLTARQILKLAIVALRKTLEEYQRPQTQPLAVSLVIEGAEGDRAGLGAISHRAADAFTVHRRMRIPRPHERASYDHLESEIRPLS